MMETQVSLTNVTCRHDSISWTLWSGNGLQPLVDVNSGVETNGSKTRILQPGFDRDLLILGKPFVDAGPQGLSRCALSCAARNA